MACCIRTHPFASTFLDDCHWPYGSGQGPTLMDLLPRSRGFTQPSPRCCRRYQPYGTSRFNRSAAPGDVSDVEALVPAFLRRLFSLEEGSKGSKTKDVEMMKKTWSETIELPPGFTPRNVEKIAIDGHRVIIELGRTFIDFEGLQSITALRHVVVPDDVVPKSIKISRLPNGAIELSGIREAPHESQCCGMEDCAESKCDKEASEEQCSCGKDDEMSADGGQDQEQTTPQAPIETPTPTDVEQSSDPTCETEDKKTESETRTESHSDGSNSNDAPNKAQDSITKVTVPDSSDTDEVANVPEDTKTLTDDQKMGASSPDDQSTTVGIFFEETLNLEPFEPSEIKLRLSGSELFIDAIHKDEDDGNVSSFEMHRSLTIPEGVDLDQLKSRVSDTGKLVISAPYVTEKPRERFLTIQRQ